MQLDCKAKCIFNGLLLELNISFNQKFSFTKVQFKVSLFLCANTYCDEYNRVINNLCDLKTSSSLVRHRHLINILHSASFLSPEVGLLGIQVAKCFNTFEKLVIDSVGIPLRGALFGLNHPEILTVLFPTLDFAIYRVKLYCTLIIMTGEKIAW